MPAWLGSALRLLAGFGVGTGVARAGGLEGSAGGGSLVDDNPFIPNIIERFLPGERFTGDHPRRRRRRRALTASDRADIAFIAGMISKAAAKDFAVQLAARPR